MLILKFPHMRTDAAGFDGPTEIYASGRGSLSCLTSAEMGEIVNAIAEEQQRRTDEAGGLTEDEIAAVRDRRILDAIKSVRYRTGLGLVDAKAIVDRFKGGGA